jgi:hypothetical protein
VRRTLRVALFLGVVVASSVLAWGWRRPPPPLERSLGALLLAHEPPRGAGDILVINGVEVRTITARFDQDLDAALPGLRAACVAGTDDLHEALDAARSELVATPDDGAEVLRDGDRAIVTCTAHGGRHRHLYAEASRSGTSVRALDSHGPLPLIGAVNGHDAPGRDLVGVPRPRGSTRLLSTFTPDDSYAMVQLALTSADLDAEQEAYVTLLESVGFEVREAPGQDATERTLIADRGSRRVIAVMDNGASTETAIVTLLDQGR